ncbi:MAG: GNAT family N-acetyltransferase [Oscillospiraceae bacterium]|nr:GNAT family N-acetyltransferase [Oscillospiraceae bacterium]
MEDVFVDEAYRGKGTGSGAINAAEEIIRQKGGYSAVCIDVVPKNTNALSVYHRLGYDTLGMVTLRKEFGDNYREDTADVLGYKFKI